MIAVHLSIFLIIVEVNQSNILGERLGLWIPANLGANSGLTFASCFSEPRFLHLYKGDRFVAKVE